MSQFPYGGYDDETGQYVEPTNPLLTRRDPNGPPVGAPQATSQGGPQGGGPQPNTSFDPSRLYQPRYMEEKPNNFGIGLMNATRQGSLLNIVGALTGGGKYYANHAYNEAEHRKFEDSLASEKVRAEAARWDSYAKAEEALAHQREQPRQWQEGLIQAHDRGEISDEQLQAGLHGVPKQPAAPKPTTALEDAERIVLNGDPDPNKVKRAHELLGLVKPPRPAPQGRAPKTVHDDDGNMYTVTEDGLVPLTVTGEPPSDNPPPTFGKKQPKTAPGERPPASPQKFKAGLVGGELKKNNGQPLSDDQMRNAGAAAAQYGRATGQMPDQRNPIGGQGGGKQYVRTGTAQAGNPLGVPPGTRIGMLPDGSMEPIQ